MQSGSEEWDPLGHFQDPELHCLFVDWWTSCHPHRLTDGTVSIGVTQLSPVNSIKLQDAFLLGPSSVCWDFLFPTAQGQPVNYLCQSYTPVTYSPAQLLLSSYRCHMPYCVSQAWLEINTFLLVSVALLSSDCQPNLKIFSLFFPSFTSETSCDG